MVCIHNNLIVSAGWVDEWEGGCVDGWLSGWIASCYHEAVTGNREMGMQWVGPRQVTRTDSSVRVMADKLPYQA